MYICTLYTVPKICTFIHYTAPKIGTFALNTVPKNVHLYTVPKICSLVNVPVPSSQKLQHVEIGGGRKNWAEPVPTF